MSGVLISEERLSTCWQLVIPVHFERKTLITSLGLDGATCNGGDCTVSFPRLDDGEA